MRYLLLLLLTGCAGASIDLSRSPPKDWPALRVVVMRVTEAQVKSACYAANLVIAYGCTVPQFQTGQCFVYLATNDPQTLAHEKLHCLGYDHPGEATMRNLWASYKRR